MKFASKSSLLHVPATEKQSYQTDGDGIGILEEYAFGMDPAATTVSDNGSIRTYKAKVPLNGADKKFLRLKLTALTN